MADDNFTDGPGGRLKKEEKKNTLYVSNPKDPRLKAYQDSLSLSKSDFYIPSLPPNGIGFFKNAEDFKKSFAEKIKKYGLARDNRFVYFESDVLPALSKHPLFAKRIREQSKYTEGIQPIDYADYNRNRSLDRNNPFTTIIYKKPERPVVLVKRPQSKPIETISPRQAPVPTFAPEEIVAPVARPVPVPITPSAPPFVPAEMAALTREDLVERPVVQRKPPKFILPTQYGGWGREPLLRRLFPRLYMKRTY
jgi:hypothetical protein